MKLELDPELWLALVDWAREHGMDLEDAAQTIVRRHFEPEIPARSHLRLVRTTNTSSKH